MSEKEFGVGPKILPKGFQFWPETEDKLFTSIEDIIESYEVKKFAGAFAMPEEKALLIEENKLITGFGSIGDAATANNWADSGAGKLVIPFVHVMEAYPGVWPGPPQVVGDCFPAGTKVLMGDTLEVAIEEVAIGDIVMSPFGGTRKVTNVIKKPYTGGLITFRSVKSDRPIQSTPDHRFVSPIGEDDFVWKSSGELSENDNVLVDGIATTITDITETPFTGEVYCLEVEVDHAFIANGYAVHNCVSHSSKNAALGTMVCEVVSGNADEVTGKREAFPEVAPDGIANGVFSSEAIYWYRRSNSHGWYCGAACRVMQNESGLWIRKNYTDLGIDLTKYNKSNAERYGAKPPTGAVAETGKLHLVRAFAEAKSIQERRDALANGYFGNTCGSESYNRTRDENGVSKQTPEGWAHAIASIGFDDRPDTIKLYGCSLELMQNSWAVWNSGPRDIRDSAKYVPADKRELWIKLDIVNPTTGNIMIPKGSFWALTKQTSNRDWFALSSVAGFPRKNLPNWGGSLAG
jgi:hypothetical protein